MMHRGLVETLVRVDGPGRSSAMTEATRILAEIEKGDPLVAEKLLPLVYDELRRLAAQKLAHEQPGQTLDATALVHEAYLRLVGERVFNGRGHFLAAAAEALLTAEDSQAADVARLRLFAGLSVEEAAAALGVSRATAFRDWAYEIG